MSKQANKPDKIAAVLGIGPGLGQALALRFARGGYGVALMARSEESLQPVAGEIGAAGGQALPVAVDATDPKSMSKAFQTLHETWGAPEVFIYNAGAFQMGEVQDLSPEDFERCWKANCYGAFLGAREVIPGMLEAGRGSILLTGATASLRGSAKFAALATGKFGLRALAQSMARELGPEGIHVAHFIIDGQIDTPKNREMMPGRGDHSFLSPEAIAGQYWQVHQQDPTTWTLEIDLRPAVEKF